MPTREAVVSVIVDVWGGMHPGGWRTPDAPTDPAMDLDRIKRMVQTAERGKVHMFFLADSLGYAMEADHEVLARTSNAARLEPFTLLSALAMVTERIGLALTASTTYTEPFNLARMCASLDHLSGGRACWNLVASTGEAAKNFNDLQVDHAQRYARAAEFHDVVTALWDSYEDDAFLRDKATGQFFAPGRLHVPGHRGEFFQVEGPLNMSRPPQGHPVIAQAGASPAGIAFASRVAEVLFTVESDVDGARALRADVRERAAAHGRDPDHIKVLSGLPVVLRPTQAEADAAMAQMDALADMRVGLERLKAFAELDLTDLPADEPVPAVASTEHGSRSMQAYYVDRAREQQLTVRQLVQTAMRFDCVAVSPVALADHIQERIEADACDGFNLSFGDALGSLEVFVDEVVPLLQERGLFRRDYAGRTLRENLGLPRPANRFATPRAS